MHINTFSTTEGTNIWTITMEILLPIIRRQFLLIQRRMVHLTSGTGQGFLSFTNKKSRWKYTRKEINCKYITRNFIWVTHSTGRRARQPCSLDTVTRSNAAATAEHFYWLTHDAALSMWMRKFPSCLNSKHKHLLTQWFHLGKHVLQK